MTSTASYPRIGQGAPALTSLGAVGGPRGVSAGALRIFVEFLTTYDPAAMSQLERDLRKADKTAVSLAGKDTARQKKLATVNRELAGVQTIYKTRLDASTRKLWRTEANLQGVRTRAGKAELATTHAQLQAKLMAAGLSSVEMGHVTRRFETEKKRAALLRQIEGAEERGKQRAGQRLDTESKLTQLQQVKSKVGPKLAGLAIGAVGGIVGGALLSVGWQLAEDALSAIGEKLQDLIDPARHARVEVKALADAVNEIASSQNIRQIDAARQFVTQLGINPASDRGTQLTGLLGEVAVRQKILDGLKQEITLQDILNNKKGLDKELRDTTRAALIAAAKANGTYTASVKQITSGKAVATIVNKEYINGVAIEDAVTQELEKRVTALTDVEFKLAEATRKAAEEAASASALWNLYAQSLATAINAAVALQTAPIDAKIAALGTGESAKTRRIQKKIDNAGSGGGDGGAKTRELANIAEERALKLLEIRLKKMGTAINLEKYSGKFLLVAINAKIAALQKEGDAQARVNQLLDLQFRMGQTIQRNQGESISDFLARRAQEQRALLSEQDDMQRQAQITALEDKKSNLEDQLALEELHQRKLDAMRSGGTASHNANLQRQLAASKAADAKALKAKKAALEKAKKLLEANAAEAIALTSETAIKETTVAIAGINTMDDVNKFSGRMAGLQRARSSIQALVEGFGLPKWIAAPFLSKLDSLLSSAGAALNKAAALQRRTGGVPFAKGGAFMMNNANQPFGSNIRAGEQGTEIGVILSHNVAKLLQNSKPSVGQVGPIYIEKSNNPYRDSYQLRKAVQSGLEAALS